MSATEELRHMLDERGVEWWNQTDPEPQTVTMARLGEQLIEYHENVNGTMGYHVWNMCDLTPEQAIAATLGSGECEIETTENWLPAERYHRCKHCGAFFAVMNASGDIQPCVCPNCGRKVKR